MLTKTSSSVGLRFGLIAATWECSALILSFFLVGLMYENIKAVDLNNVLTEFVGAVLPMYILICLVLRLFDLEVLEKPHNHMGRLIAAVAVTFSWFAMMAFFLKFGINFSRVQIGLTALLHIALLILGRVLIGAAARREISYAHVGNIHLVDGSPCFPLTKFDWVDLRAVGIRPDPNSSEMVSGLANIVMGRQRITLHCTESTRSAWAFMLKCVEVPSEIITPDLNDLGPIGIATREGFVALAISSGPLTWSQNAQKRVFDLVGGVVALFLLSPVFIAVAVAIKLESAGPVLFTQERIGLGNRKFRIYKFRSMYVNQQDPEARKLTLRNDPRVTKVGSFIRRTSLDELPQLFNVVAGHMSLVGPRPHAELALAGESLYWEVDQTYWHRHVVKPGITGLAQVRGHRGNTFKEDDLRNRLQSDLEYVHRWNLATDILIILRTVTQLFNSNAF